MNISRDKVLWIALAIPVLMVVFVAGSIYIPRLNAVPAKYNFVYAIPSADYYSQDYNYSVKDGKIEREKTTPPPENYIKPFPQAGTSETRLYVHDVTSNTSKEITFEEASAFKLDANLEAPDGYALQQGTGGGIFPFFVENNNYQNRYLVHGNYSQAVAIKGFDRGYNSFQFLGWVIP